MSYGSHLPSLTIAALALCGLNPAVASAQSPAHQYSREELQSLKAQADEELERCMIATAVQIDDEALAASIVAKAVVAGCSNEVRESGFYYAYAQLGDADAAAKFSRKLPDSPDTHGMAVNIVLTVRKVRHDGEGTKVR
jgi:hypothetical protein